MRRDIVNAVMMTARRHFYGHWFERRARRWFTRCHPGLIPAHDTFWRVFNKIQTAIAYPLLRGWLEISGRFRKLRAVRNEARIKTRLDTMTNPPRTIHLTPVMGRRTRGSIDHYYHFMFDLLLPLSRLIKQTPDDVTFTLKRFGGVSYLLKETWPDRIRLVPDVPDSAHAILYGMSPRETHVSAKDLDAFSLQLIETTGAKPSGIRDTVLMIERPMPIPGASKVLQSGGRRRRIRNHSKVAAAVEQRTRGEWRFVDTSLEGMPLKDQIELFDRAVLVIAQHGAALGNLIFAQKDTMVIEIYNNYYLDFFRILSAKKDLDHRLWPVTSGHPMIHPNQFANFVSETLNSTSTEITSHQPSTQI